MPKTDNGSFDDLLGIPLSDEEKASESKDEGLSPEQLRIRELEEALAKAQAEKEALVPKDEPKVDHAAAVAANRKLDSYEPPFEEADGETVLIHFLDDGLTLFSRVWEKGQEAEFVRGGAAYESTKNRRGYTILDHLSHEEQVARWGRIRVGFGPYPGKPVPDELKDPEEIRRGRRVPVFA